MRASTRLAKSHRTTSHGERCSALFRELSSGTSSLQIVEHVQRHVWRAGAQRSLDALEGFELGRKSKRRKPVGRWRFTLASALLTAYRVGGARHLGRFFALYGRRRRRVVCRGEWHRVECSLALSRRLFVHSLICRKHVRRVLEWRYRNGRTLESPRLTLSKPQQIAGSSRAHHQCCGGNQLQAERTAERRRVSDRR